MIVQRTFLIAFFIHVHCSHGFTKDDEICYYPRANIHLECDFAESRQRLVCFNGFKDEWRARVKDVQVLIFCVWPKATFDPQEILRGFTYLRKLMIANSNLTRLSTAFPSEMQFLEKINVTDTKLRLLPNDAFSNLRTLSCLDLRNNALEEISITVFDVPTLKDIYLAGNPLRCTEDVAWILDSSEGSAASKVVDKDKLLCATPHDGRPLVPIVEIIVTLKEECKETVCDCELIYVVARAGKLTQRQLIAFTSVNCSHRDLTEMPEILPADTTTLHLSGNKIKDLTPLATNPAYKSVLDLYIDDNLVESIARLEGSDWLDRFRLLNLRGNKLTDLPTYALENALLYNSNAANLYLGNNSWTCDCHFTPGFQDLLIRHPNIIKDINDIRCAFTSDNDNSNKQIRDLTRTEICISPDEDSWLHPLDILNIILASLIFLVLGKLLYDYWSFKKTGKLPWIVAKIP
ncbi:protein singed wings 2 isoform X1 [Mycetomoellerius zeteki]|uniref:protein singed wings 2 isoform X1 n=1 Tax=Mycetomoellerius zeteki TaxID=64791 RepID=UPI00084E55A4|nr:PREDICTED: protein singed wings 2 isoform X1 [Trachymyrmex zeteki]